MKKKSFTRSTFVVGIVVLLIILAMISVSFLKNKINIKAQTVIGKEVSPKQTGALCLNDEKELWREEFPEQASAEDFSMGKACSEAQESLSVKLSDASHQSVKDCIFNDHGESRWYFTSPQYTEVEWPGLSQCFVSGKIIVVCCMPKRPSPPRTSPYI